MSDFQINDHLLSKECHELAAEIIEEIEVAEDETLEDHRDEITDRIHETADGHSWVIYNHSALMICAHCDTEMGEEFLEDVGMPDKPTFYQLACLIAYGQMRGLMEQAVDEIIAEKVDA